MFELDREFTQSETKTMLMSNLLLTFSLYENHEGSNLTLEKKEAEKIKEKRRLSPS